MFVPLNLAFFTSVSSAAKELTSKFTRLDCLMNNAGIMAVPTAETEEGYEIQFGTNNMGHALLTKLLMPILRVTAEEPDSDVRIINLTSEGHNFARTGPTLLDPELLKPLNTWTRYGYSKLASILFTSALGDHYPEITSIAVHPGLIQTDLYITNQHLNPVLRTGLAIGGSLRSSVATGLLNQLWAATGKKTVLQSGAYYKPVAARSAGSPSAQNTEFAQHFWDVTEKELVAKAY